MTTAVAYKAENGEIAYGYVATKEGAPNPWKSKDDKRFCLVSHSDSPLYWESALEDEWTLNSMDYDYFFSFWASVTRVAQAGLTRPQNQNFVVPDYLSEGFLIFDGRLHHLDRSMVHKEINGAYAIGSSAPYALGAMWMAQQTGATPAIICASGLRAASELDPKCGNRPFIFGMN